MLIWFHTLTISVPNIRSAKNSKVVSKTSCSYILPLRCQCRWELEIQKSKWEIFDSYYVESCNFIRVACKGYTRDRQFSCGVSIGDVRWVITEQLVQLVLFLWSFCNSVFFDGGVSHSRRRRVLRLWQPSADLCKLSWNSQWLYLFWQLNKNPMTCLEY